MGLIAFAFFNPNLSLDTPGINGKPTVKTELVQAPSAVIVQKYGTDLNSIADIIARDSNKSDSDKRLVAMHFHYLGSSTIANEKLVKSTADVVRVNQETGGAIFTDLKVPSTPGLNDAVDSLLMKVGGQDAVNLDAAKRKEFIDVLDGIAYVTLNGRL